MFVCDIVPSWLKLKKKKRNIWNSFLINGYGYWNAMCLSFKSHLKRWKEQMHPNKTYIFLSTKPNQIIPYTIVRKILNRSSKKNKFDQRRGSQKSHSKFSFHLIWFIKRQICEFMLEFILIHVYENSKVREITVKISFNIDILLSVL